MPKRVHRSAEAFTYVLLADRGLPADQQSRFRFRPLTVGEKLAALDGLNWVSVAADGTREVMPRAFVQSLQLVLEHLESAENFPTDEPRAWPANGSEEQQLEYLGMLDELDLLELGNEIRHHAAPERPVPAPALAVVPAGAEDTTTPEKS